MGFVPFCMLSLILSQTVYFCIGKMILYIEFFKIKEAPHGRAGEDFRKGGLTAYRKGQVGLRQQCPVLRCQSRPCEARGDAEVFERRAESARDRGKGQGDDRLRRRGMRRVTTGRLPVIIHAECAREDRERETVVRSDYRKENSFEWESITFFSIRTTHCS